ncbi:TIGR00282 family metallophosphoesterase [Candidatus Uhrbacteria bacterium]|nr:TIGR00282 family metallophosphoesterase [Candidatus Uhrbacteria bacterium]
MKILFIGDIVGKPARRAVQALLPDIRKEYGVDYCIANAENLAHGKGVTEETLRDIMLSGVDLCTSGNHIWSKPQGVELLKNENSSVLRPHNYPENNPGTGVKVVSVGNHKLMVINLMGNVNMPGTVDHAFFALDDILKKYDSPDISGIFVDFHAEVTSEKNAFGLYADGRVSAVVGTHTHIPTADTRVLPKGTAYTTDVGMVGLKNSSLGINYESVIGKFLHQIPSHHEIDEHGLVVFNSVLVDIDPLTRTATSIVRIQKDIDV